MDIPELLKLANEEGGEQAFGEALQAHTQDAVTAAVEKIATEKAVLATSVGKLEAKNKEMADEWKPVQKVLKDQSIGFAEADLPALAERLKGKPGGEPTDDVKALARELAGPIAAEATVEYTDRISALEAEGTEKDAAVAAAVAHADSRHLQLLVREAEIGKDRPQLVPAFRQHFIDDKIVPFVHFDETESNGKTRRIPSVRDGDVPIMRGTRQATVTDLVDLAYEGKGDKEYNTGTRDYFASAGTGTGARPPGAPPIPAGQDELGKAESIADYEKKRFPKTA